MRPGLTRGATMLELTMAMAVAGLLAALTAAGVRPLAASVAVEASRMAVLDALTEARRRAYERESNVQVELAAGSGSVVLQPGARKRRLADGVAITAAPADGTIEFRASGLADNATVTLAAGAATATVVVNQRGVVR
ncbi:MAG TPA: hypothetical protein VEC57_05505 [Candidatus Limnocylindrales bacterium]|nr:hypothetical protein [Candidatus Limnocylindrales bacterium]